MRPRRHGQCYCRKALLKEGVKNQNRQEQGSECCNHYPRLGNRSIFYLDSSVGNTFTFGVVGRKQVQISLRTFILQKLLRAQPLKTYLPGSPGIGTKWVGQPTAVYGTGAPNIPPFREKGGVIRITLGWVIDR